VPGSASGLAMVAGGAPAVAVDGITFAGPTLLGFIFEGYTTFTDSEPRCVFPASVVSWIDCPVGVPFSPFTVNVTVSSLITLPSTLAIVSSDDLRVMLLASTPTGAVMEYSAALPFPTAIAIFKGPEIGRSCF
jgi:hypothetical protein